MNDAAGGSEMDNPLGETPTGVVTAENRGTDEGLVSAYDDAPERPHRPQDARQALTDCSRKQFGRFDVALALMHAAHRVGQVPD